MQKIIIKNFGAIEYAEIEIKKVLVLIGEQASGKSTIAKLIYFFKSLKDDVFNQIYQDQERDYFDENSDIAFVLQEKFYNWFGSTEKLIDFEIKFYYFVEINKYLHLSLNKDKTIQCEFSQDFYKYNIPEALTQIKLSLQQGSKTTNIHERLAHEKTKINYAQILAEILNNLFHSYEVDSLFVIAGRSITVGYSELFEKYFFADLQSRLEKNSKKEFQQKSQIVNEILMMKFIERVIYVKDVFSVHGKFQDLISRFRSSIKDKDKDKEEKSNLYLAEKKIVEILKGEYISNNLEEKIILNTQESIDLHNASSGQQESIRILQDIFFVILKQSKVLRIVEEPETHLFPVAQKSLIELLALMVNQNDNNQLIITTHSPYVLTVFNNLLFAQRVVDKNPLAEAEVAELIPKEFWLKAKDFSAYSLGNSSIQEEHEYCESIFNNQTGAIQQNYLDAVSEMLGGDFNYLYGLYTKISRKK
ncbi:AAA family ATPase [Pseudanabaena sp. BC1403]|uniref:AAA family ATPase n=1 Tax=Pseudanabaena sp. BC1403 TaxID=2043171 RepID=UPI000CD83D2D|nr:AAA family ATPase [Pseudanabaena sp. BC1403]